MNINEAINQLEQNFNSTEAGQSYAKQLSELDSKHESLTKQVNDLAQKKRANRRSATALKKQRDSERNDYVVEQLSLMGRRNQQQS